MLPRGARPVIHGSTVGSSPRSPRPASTAGPVVRPGHPCAPTCASTRPAAAAQLAGFRACKRCRPDATPGSPEWDTRGDVVARAMRLIADGLVDREGVSALATAARLQRPSTGATPVGRGRRRSHRHRPGPARPDGPSTHRDHGAAHDRGGLRRRILQHPPVQRHGAGGIRQLSPPISDRVRRRRVTVRRRPTGCADYGSPSDSHCVPTTSSATWRPPPCPASRRSAARTYRRTLDLAHGPGIVELTPTPEHIVCRGQCSPTCVT